MLTTFLKDIKDFRRPQGQRYSLHHTLLFSFMAICCNANTYRQIGEFIESNFMKLSHYFDLDWKRAPHHTTIRNHIKGVATLELEAAFRAYTQHQLPAAAFSELPYNHIAVDGKTLCGSNDPSTGSRAVQSFSFFDVTRKLILGQISISEKTNEIPVFQQLLKELEIPNCIFTADALHLQKRTFELATEKGHRLLIQLKDNQKALEEDVLQVVKLEQPTAVYEAPVEQGHSRIEYRKTTVYHRGIDSHLLEEQWAIHIKTIVCLERSRQSRDTATGQWKRSEEKAYYLANEVIDAPYACQLIRDHWTIENCNHYVKDVSFYEDGHKIRKQAFNFSILRSLALNFFRHHKLNNIKHQRYAFSLNWTKLYDYPQLI